MGKRGATDRRYYSFMKKTGVIITIWLTMVWPLYSCNVGQQSIERYSSILEIEFQNFFESDTISVEINGCLIVKNRLITSLPASGTTDLNISIFNIRHNELAINGSDISRTCHQNLNHIIDVVIVVNSRRNNCRIDPKLGKYYGISMGLNNTVDIIQINRPFIHD